MYVQHTQSWNCLRFPCHRLVKLMTWLPTDQAPLSTAAAPSPPLPTYFWLLRLLLSRISSNKTIDWSIKLIECSVNVLPTERHMQTVDQQPGRNRGKEGTRPGTHTHMSIVTCVTCKTTHDLMGLANLSFSPAQLQLQFHSMCSRHLNWCNSSSGSRCTCKWDYCGRGAGESGRGSVHCELSGS